MRVIVTGGAGFIGANFLHRVVPRHPSSDFLNLDALTYAANLSSLDAMADAPNYRFVKADITEGATLAAIVRDFRPDLVVHFAAESHVDRSIEGPLAFVRTNIEGTFHLLEACRAIWNNSSTPGLFHHVSTDEVYGSLPADGHFTESTPYDPSSPYSASKASSDHLVRAYARTFGLRTRITNCSNNYGPFQFPEKLIPLMIQNAIERKPLPVYGRGDNIRDWLYVEDHCDAIWAVIEKGRDGETYNVGGNSERKNLEVVRTLCTLVAEESGASVDELLGLITFVQDRPGHDFRYAIDASKVRRECGWQPKETFETGLRRTVRWYLDNPAWVDRVRTGEYRRWITQNYEARGKADPEHASPSTSVPPVLPPTQGAKA